MRNKGIKIVLNILIIAAATSVVLGYAYFRTQDYLEGPHVTVDRPTDGETITNNPQTIISGTTERVSDISLNGRKIFIDKDGNFSENILLYPGYNVITIQAFDRFDKMTSKTLHLIYQDT